jgi:hypothetical protein
VSRDTERFALGQRGSDERRNVKRRMMIDAHVQLVLGAAMASLESGWIGQEHSPLGAARHVEAVRRRIAAGDRRTATLLDGRYLLTVDAVVDEFFGDPEPTLAAALGGLRRMSTPNNDNAGPQR